MDPELKQRLLAMSADMGFDPYSDTPPLNVDLELSGSSGDPSPDPGSPQAAPDAEVEG